MTGTITGFMSEPIYKMDTKGNIRIWQVEVKGDSYRTHAGIKDGSIVTSGWTKCTAASQDTDEAQARFEAEALRKNKLDREYYPTLAQAESGVPAMFKPMLAKDYTKEGKKVEKYLVAGGTLLVQPKLDGLRCVITRDGARSRQNQEYASADHIKAVLEPFFDEYPNAVLDGELYNHELKADFEKITSMARREDFDASQAEELVRLLQYHIYDGFLDEASKELPWTERYSAIVAAVIGSAAEDPGKTINFVGFVQAFGDPGVRAAHQNYINAGYEGSIIRLDRPYENKRSSHLLKFKDFDTTEFKILAIEEGNGNWAGCAKRFQLGNLDGSPFYDDKGNPDDDCWSGVRGSMTEMAKVLAEKDAYVGGEITVRHFGLTNGGKPRFPVGIDLHPNGRVD